MRRVSGSIRVRVLCWIFFKTPSRGLKARLMSMMTLCRFGHKPTIGRASESSLIASRNRLTSPLSVARLRSLPFTLIGSAIACGPIGGSSG